MEVQFGPNAVDEPNLLYKLQRKIKVFNTGSTLPNRGYNLVTSSSKHGIVFIGAPDGTLSVYQLKDLMNKDSEPQHFSVKLSEKPTHISVSCDDELLAVTGGQFLCVYKVTDFQNVNISPAVIIKLDTNPSTFVSALQWNPCIPDNIAMAFFDGTLLVASVTSNQVKKVQQMARCICWSPKGKQLVTGNSDGSLCQYKPDLTLAKKVPPPNLFEGAPVEALAIYWISTYQFAVVFRNASNDSRPAVTIVNTPKTGQPTCINYEDVCYSMGSNRPWFYYLLGLAQWNMILASSSNSMEIATLGSADGTNWLQWCQSDEARPELPLTDKKVENYPVGVCINISSIHQLPWGENETLPYMPLLLVVSQSGLLTMFNMINLNKKAPQVCNAPQQQQLITLPAAALTSDIPDDAPTQVTLPPPPSASAAPKPQAPAMPQPVQTPQAVQPASAFGASGQTFGASSQPIAGSGQPIGSSGQSFGSSGQPFGTSSQPIPGSGQRFGGSGQPFGATGQAFGGGQLFGSKPFAAPQTTQSASAASTQPPSESKLPEVKPITASTPQVPVQAQPKTQAVKPQAPPPEVNAALKAEQEKANKGKLEQELKNMLVKEVNDFQSELYNFVVKTREMQNKLQQDLNSIDSNPSLQSVEPKKFSKDCDLEEMREAVVQLKLELVRSFAVVADAQTHAEARGQHLWTQVDPLTTKRVASIKKLAYYVKTQLEQAQKALDYKWNEMSAKNPEFNKPGQYMIRPILDDVYQPLVKQQEILSRQQAVLRTLKNQLKGCDVNQTWRGESLLRSTPFRNKDPLSKLAKDVINMSLEPQMKPKDLLTPQKLDALRDMLSNHKPTKIKPINVELRQKLAQMKINYQKSMMEKAAVQPNMDKPKLPAKAEPQVIPQLVKVEPVAPVKPAPQMAAKNEPVPKPVPVSLPISIPSFTPVNTNQKPTVPGLANVARTLFADDKPTPPTQEPVAAFSSQPVKLQTQQPMFGFNPPSTLTTASLQTRSTLKDMLQNKQASNEAKSDPNNLFMGQRICSPSAFSSPPSQPASMAPSIFTSKPISEINNMFNKFTQPQTVTPKIQSGETGEHEAQPKPVEPKKNGKSAPALQVKIPDTTHQNIPDIIKTNNQAAVKPEKSVPKAEKVSEKSKENVSQKPNENIPPQKPTELEKKETTPKPLFGVSNNKPSVPLFGAATSTPIAPSISSTTSEPTKPAEVKESKPKEDKPKIDIKPETPKVEKSEAQPSSPSASSLFAAANASSPTTPKPEPFFGTTPTPQSSTSTAVTKEEVTPASSRSLIFAAAASQPFGTPTQSGSIFSSPSITSVTSAQGSIFGTAISSAETKPTVFSTPVPSSPTSVFGSTATTQPGSLFASAAASQSSVFGSGTTFGTTPTTTAAPLFGATTSAPSVFGVATTTTAQSVFASAVVTSAQSTADTAAPTTPQSVFATAVSASSPSIFGASTATAASVFGTATATTTQSLFGATTTTTQSVFGAASSTSIFGSAVQTTQAQASVFGSPTTTAQSVFGAPATQASIFGSPTSTPTPASIFGTAAATTQPSVFGATQGSVFGTPTTQTSVFGTATSTPASVFGTPTQTTQASVFGTPPATTAGGSLFGGADNLFAAASISTTSAGSPTSGGSIFGGGGSTGSVFGGGASNTNVFGGKSTFSQSNPQAAAIFGGGSAFGQKPANSFWSGGNTTGSSFGSPGFGQQAATTQASSIFGGGSGGSFSSPSTGQPFGSPQQTSVFGSPQQQTSPGFGGSPVFGGKPAFGQPAASFGSPPAAGGGFGSFGGFNKSPSGGFGAPAAFGSSATFGGTAAFGSTSPGKMFGGAAPAPSFAPTQSNATFESLATQNTLTFGNLAQQSSPPSQPAPSFNASPSFTGWRG